MKLICKNLSPDMKDALAGNETTVGTVQALMRRGLASTHQYIEGECRAVLTPLGQDYKREGATIARLRREIEELQAREGIDIADAGPTDPGMTEVRP